jgi:hypothetical protein
MTLDLEIAGGTSDLGFQVWAAVKNLCWKTLDPAILFGSKISALDPRKVLENLGSWLLDPYNVRLENFKSELFQT